jgi:hypothetical protein
MTETEELLENFKQHYCNIESLNDFYSTLKHTDEDEMPEDVWLLFVAARDALFALDAVLWSD